MNDPYKVLGVSPQASDEELKSAYRELAKKYHPDQYADSPLKDLADEKMREINDAYDTVLEQRRSGNPFHGNSSRGGTAGSYGSSRSYGSYQEPSQFADIRRMINANRMTEADELLEGVPAARRDAEWFFLKGSVLYAKGWLDQAAQHYMRAVNMSPNNPEYRAALNRIQWQQNQGRGMRGYRTNQPATTAGCSGCDVCSSLICADCCCECMGGDLIRCC